MPYSLPPHGGGDNVLSTIDGEAGGASYCANKNQNKTATSHTSKIIKRRLETQTANDDESNNKLHRGVYDDDKSSSNNRSTASDPSASNIDDDICNNLLPLMANEIALLFRLYRLAEPVIGEDDTAVDEWEGNNQDVYLNIIVAKLIDYYQSLTLMGYKY